MSSVLSKRMRVGAREGSLHLSPTQEEGEGRDRMLWKHLVHRVRQKMVL